MANERRTRRAAAEVDDPDAKVAVDDVDENEEPEAAVDGELTADEDPGRALSLSREDFDNNPAVIDMASIVDASLVVDEEGDAQPKPLLRRTSRSAAPESTAAEEYGTGRQRVRLVGLRNGGRVPHGVSVIVPVEIPEDGGYDQSHSEGETIAFMRGRTVSVSARAARWLAGHPVYIVQKA